MTEQEKNAKLETIAKLAGIETLETRNSDRLDFYDVHVATIREMLLAAYKLGAQSTK